MKPSDFYKWIILTIVLLLLLWLAVHVVNKSLYNDKTYRREIARYEDSVNRASYQLIKSKDSAKREAFLVIDRLEDSISSLNSQLAEGDAESTQIQTTNNEKIKYINRLSTDSLAVFFTRRYAKN